MAAVRSDSQVAANIIVSDHRPIQPSQQFTGFRSDFASPLLPLSPIPGDDLLTVKEVAAILKVCTATVYKIIDRGELPHTRVLNSIRVRKSDLAAFLAR